MKIAFTTSGDDLNAPLDPRFGRAAKFLVFDPDSGAIEVLDNRQNLHAAQGAGIQAAEIVARSGAKVLISGHCGPKAFRVLMTAGIKIYPSQAGTLAEALQQYQEGKLAEARSADVDGHWV